MPFGYSNQFVKNIQKRFEGNPEDPVLELCYLCIENNIMLSDAATRLEVSKQAVYNWIGGAYSPRPKTIKKIEKLNQRLKKQIEKSRT